MLRYLKKTLGRGILFKANQSLKVEVFTDADWAGSQDDRKSTTGYCSFVGGNLVSWKSKKQNVVARSSAEAEYRAMTQGVCEGLWLKIILQYMGLQVNKPVTIYCDNKTTISIAHNLVQHDRTKHVEVDRHFIKDQLDKRNICTPFVNSFDQLADVFTKGLCSDNFKNNTDKGLSTCVITLAGMFRMYLNVLALWLLFLLFSSWLAYLIFEDTLQGKTVFSSYGTTLYQMFVLFTTSNNPDVWIPAYNKDRSALLAGRDATSTDRRSSMSVKRKQI
ncbi:Two pore calcium channel protein 1 [Platanthera zijinensis]|uniref:Two pore calcium channel protein 1 n=1 Tax=Platanthera zijinensis TaxID=2320716 RepID=A0AAP0BSW9_9ASPA